jgi:hypothetical protein
VLGKEHPDTLTSMNDLASTLSNQRRLHEAAELEVRVLDTRTQTLGPEHPDTCTSMVNLAYTWFSQGRGEDSITLLKEAARLQGEVLGFDHHDAISLAQTRREWVAAMETIEDTSSPTTSQQVPVSTTGS